MGIIINDEIDTSQSSVGLKSRTDAMVSLTHIQSRTPRS